MRTNKIKYLQGFTTIDLILLISIMFTVVSIVTPIVVNGVESSRIDKAQKELKLLAHEAAFLPLVQSNKDRSIASEGVAPYEKSMGLDPWGQPYRKSVIKDLKGKAILVVVWSTGPDGIPETAELEPDLKSGRALVHFGGDDFGSVANITN